MKTKVGMNNIWTVLIGALFIFNGCSSKNLPPEEIKQVKADMHTKAYQLKITPIIGSRQDDAKVIMDMGKIMKIWIAPYKNGHTFVSSHDNFVVAVEPDFVVGETVPQRNWRSLKTPINSVPFLFRDADLDSSNKLEKEEIIKYNNNVYVQQNDEAVAKTRIKQSAQYDEEIKNYLKK